MNSVRKHEKRQHRFTQINSSTADNADAADVRAGRLIEEQLTHRIVGAFYHVYDRLGFGFLESVYRRALSHELKKRGLRVQEEVVIDVWYDGIRVGDSRADLVVEEKVVVEIKASHLLSDSDWKQLLNYL